MKQRPSASITTGVILRLTPGMTVAQNYPRKLDVVVFGMSCCSRARRRVNGRGQVGRLVVWVQAGEAVFGFGETRGRHDVGSANPKGHDSRRFSFTVIQMGI